MNSIEDRLTNKTRQDLEKMLADSNKRGDLREVNRCKAVLSVLAMCDSETVSRILRVCRESIRIWLNKFILKGVEGLKSAKPTGRPSKLTKKEKTELKRLISRGTKYAGFPGACRRSPMVREMILQRFGVPYSAAYIAQLLKNLGYSFRKAGFVAGRKDAEPRRKWLEETWPEIARLAKKKKSQILFGDEASFPQWGSLTRTWSKRGRQRESKTSGIRKGYKVLGFIDYFTGRFFSMGHEGRLNSEVCERFIRGILSRTRKHTILIQDGASYHTGKAMKLFFEKRSKRLAVYQLPSYSPDYNPIEKLWKKIKEKEIHLHYFPTFDPLKKKVNEALLHFGDMKEQILSLFVKYQKLSEAG